MAVGNAITLGMIADGATDNTPLMQQALNSCVSAGYTGLYIPAGNYNFVLKGTPVNMPANFTVYGDSPTSSILLVDPVSWNYCFTGKTFTLLRYNNACTLYSLGFDGQKAATNNGNPTIYGLNFLTRTNNTDSDCTFTDLTFSNQLSGGIQLECFCLSTGLFSQRMKFLRVTCQDGNGTGISINGDMPTEIASPGNGLANNMSVSNCRGTNMKWQGITCYGARNITINNFYGSNNGSSAVYGGSGINLEWTQNVTINGGTVENNMGPGIGGFGWHDNVMINGVLIQNNNLLDYSNLAEVGFQRGGWYTNGFPASSRKIISGVLQSMTIHNCTIIPKTSGTYSDQLHVPCDYAVSYPSATASQPVNVAVERTHITKWKADAGSASASVYANDTVTSANGSWLPLTIYAVGDQRRNAGYIFQCTTAGTSASGPGPSAGGTGVSVTDGAVVWTSSALSIDKINAGTPWCKSTGYVRDDVRINNGYAYRVLSPISGYATSGSGDGPAGITVGGSEVDGGVTWSCEGKVIATGTYNVKPQDAWQPGIFFNNPEGTTASVASPLTSWNATGLTATVYTGSGSTSGSAVTLTSTARGTYVSLGQSFKDPHVLSASQLYMAIIRYKNVTSDNCWHFGARSSGVYSINTGANQFDTQLSSPILDQGWYIAHMPFTIPSGSSATPMLFYSGPNTGAQIVIDYMFVVPLGTDFAMSTHSPLRFGVGLQEGSFAPGDRMLSKQGFDKDMVCISAGTFGDLRPVRISMAAGAVRGTIDRRDAGVSPGMWVRIAESDVHVVRRILFVHNNEVELDNAVSQHKNVENADMKAHAPMFVPASSVEASPYLRRITIDNDTTMLEQGWNHIESTSASHATLQLPPARVGQHVGTVNATQATLRVTTYAVTDAIGANRAANLNLQAGQRISVYCFHEGEWQLV